MSYAQVTANPFTVPGSISGILDIRKRGTISPVVSITIPAYSGNVSNLYSINFEGDSTSASEPDTWPEQLQTLAASSGLTQYVNWNKYATSGDSIGAGGSDMLSDGQKAAVVSGFSTTAARNILYIMAGVNDMQGGADAQTTYNRLKSLVQYYVAQGYIVIVYTITSSRSAASPEPVEFFSRVKTFNSFIRAGFNDGTLGATVLIDLAVDSRVGGYDGPTTAYFKDGLHYSTSGGYLIAHDYAVRALPYAAAGTKKAINENGESDSAIIPPVTDPSALLILDSASAGNTAAKWNDLSGKNNHLVQPDATRQMTLVQDGVNHLPAYQNLTDKFFYVPQLSDHVDDYLMIFAYKSNASGEAWLYSTSYDGYLFVTQINGGNTIYNLGNFVGPPQSGVNFRVISMLLTPGTNLAKVYVDDAATPQYFTYGQTLLNGGVLGADPSGSVKPFVGLITNVEIYSGGTETLRQQRVNAIRSGRVV